MLIARNGFVTLAATALVAAGYAGCGDEENNDVEAGAGTTAVETTATEPATTAVEDSGAAAGDTKVQIASFKYDPPEITVKAGSKVEWTNEDDAPHTSTASDAKQKAKFDTDTIKKGETKSVTFSTAGTYKYFCVFHPFMTGTVTVE